jgi:hypothetical protein
MPISAATPVFRYRDSTPRQDAQFDVRRLRVGPIDVELGGSSVGVYVSAVIYAAALWGPCTGATVGVAVGVAREPRRTARAIAGNNSTETRPAAISAAPDAGGSAPSR